MNAAEAKDFSDRWLALWTGNRPEALAAAYAEDAFYRDPGRPGGITGRAALLDYLRRLLARFPDWRWRTDAVFPVEGGFVVRWRATIPVAGAVVEETGMDLVLVRDGLIVRNEVYFDRTALLAAAG